MKFAPSFAFFSALLFPTISSAADIPARELYESLNTLRVDATPTYQISSADRIELRRGDVQLSFEVGKLAFLASYQGRITGAVFSGRGHALAIPHGIVEKQQMARFLGAPLLDQDFTSACLRFTDKTADELLHQLRNAKVSPESDPDFASRWNPLLAPMNSAQTLRIMYDFLSQHPPPYFYAWLDGVASGPFDVLLDPLRDEQLLLGQLKKSGNRTFYDVWASYQLPDLLPPTPAFRILQYSIDTSILPNASIEGKTSAHLRAERGGERLVIFQLSRMLNVSEVTGDHGEPLAYFQNEGINLRDRGTRGSDYLCVVLPAPLERASELSLHFRYAGNVIEDAGNGVFFVGARETWYPRLGDAADFAHYDLTIRWPRRLRLVATGSKIDEREEGDFRVGHWRTDKATSIAGFNLGDYASASFASSSHSIEVFANRQLEQALSNRLRATEVDVSPFPPALGPEGARNATKMMQTVPLTPSPVDALKQLGHEIDSSIHFYETFSGPFPFQKLNVSQIPGTFGQGWPGLLYLSTFSFLPPATQQRAGISETGQEQLTELVPFHEVAHQWWGNLVGWSSYRDQWIDEAIANYLALLFADSQKRANHSLRLWLTRYRRQLLEKPPGEEQPPAEIGALDLGSRLTSSKSPAGFEQVIYSKGSWVIHMLREMLRQPGAKNPDARFVALLNTLASKYAYRALSVTDLQREVQAVMTPAMDLEGGHSMEWFFEEWVRGTGIPHYRVQFSVHENEKGHLVSGKLFQSGVPRSFIARVPLYANISPGHVVFLGTLVTEGPETSFRFVAEAAPRKIAIDPQMTLLCVAE